MSDKIQIMPENLINKIAAGEVIERPASVVKELMENGLDAGASKIEVYIINGGKSLIKVKDNGNGMTRNDALLATNRHATSKIITETDLNNINTFGFRGEALSSIAEVSNFNIETCYEEDNIGSLVKVKNGNIVDVKDTGRAVGTTIEVHRLFNNVPARRKYMRTKQTESNYIMDVFNRFAMAFPKVSFKLVIDERTVYDYVPVSQPEARIGMVLGREIEKRLISFNNEQEKINVCGYIAKPEVTRATRSHQYIYVNNRYIYSRTIRHALDEAYKGLLPINRYPIGVVFLNIDPNLVDVNVHPTKIEVRFFNNKTVHDNIRDTIREVLVKSDLKHNPELAEKLNAVIPESKSKPKETKSEPVQFEIPDQKKEKTISPPKPVSKPAQEEKSAVKPTFKEKKHDMEIQSRLFKVGKIIGQYNDTFILMESGDGMLLIDQHTVHERILYEEFKNKILNDSIPIQGLINPIPVELAKPEFDIIMNNKNILTEIGIDFEEFGDTTILVKGINAYLKEIDADKLVHDMIDIFKEKPYSDNRDEVWEDVLTTMACRGAVKAGQKLEFDEMIDLLNQLEKTENPYTCPHGRPTIIVFELKEIYKRFKRI